jgi:N-acetyl-gamma-glutamyl-phosphate reductase
MIFYDYSADVPEETLCAFVSKQELGHFVTVSADGRRVVLVATLDNLQKGAATQALQNVNLALHLPEVAGVSDSKGLAR